MRHMPRGGRDYRVYGADQATGKDAEIIVRAYDEADASRLANRKGLFVGHYVPVAAEGTFARAVADDAVAHALMAKFPDLGYRFTRLNAEDQAYLLDLAGQRTGVTRDEASHIAELIRRNRDLPRA